MFSNKIMYIVKADESDGMENHKEYSHNNDSLLSIRKTRSVFILTYLTHMRQFQVT